MQPLYIVSCLTCTVLERGSEEELSFVGYGIELDGASEGEARFGRRVWPETEVDGGDDGQRRHHGVAVR